tara:strand:+ start:103 stop:684 length:582 start_codon:yes stop_codon:yes gene_type:complete
MPKYTLKCRQISKNYSRKASSEEIPKKFFYNDNSSLECPITFEIFYDPVIAEDGHTYEKWAILKWFEENNTSPKTNQIIGKCLIPNIALKILIDQINQSQPTPFKYNQEFMNNANMVKNITLQNPDNIRNQLNNALNTIKNKTKQNTLISQYINQETLFEKAPYGIRIQSSENLQTELEKLLFSSESNPAIHS